MKDPKILPQQERENPEPTEGNRSIPWLVLFFVSLMIAFGIVYISMSDANNPSAWGDGRTIEELADKVSDSSQPVDGAALYASMCAACHQAKGQGLPGVFPPLAGSERALGKASTPIAIVLHGLSGELTAQGKTYNGAMPAFGGQLSDAQLAAVLTHIRSSWGNSAEAVQASAVAAVRDSLKGRSTPFAGEQSLKELP